MSLVRIRLLHESRYTFMSVCIMQHKQLGHADALKAKQKTFPKNSTIIYTSQEQKVKKYFNLFLDFETGQIRLRILKMRIKTRMRKMTRVLLSPTL